MGVTYELIEDGTIALIKLDRPDKLNALDGDMLMALKDRLTEASQSGASAIIISSSSTKAFCAGADLSYLSQINSADSATEFFMSINAITKSIRESPKIVIAAINGYCLGGGNEIAISCDFRIASSGSVFGQPEVKIGLAPGGSATYRLRDLVGVQMARELILTGRNVAARDAHAMGLVDSITENIDSLKSAIDYAKSLMKNNLVALSLSKRAINKALDYDHEAEQAAFVESFTSGSAKAGIAAFLNSKKKT